MRLELLKILTADDIREILNAEELLRQQEGEPTAEKILRSILDENECPPSVGERFPLVLSCAEIAVGRKLSRERCKDNTTIRAFIAYQLRQEGYGYNEIGRMMQRDHSSVIHLYKLMCDILSVPNAYKDEIEMFQRFEEELTSE